MRGETRKSCHNQQGRQDFNPLAPCGARPVYFGPFRRFLQFQSTRPVRGETRSWWSLCRPWRYFNPLAPCGARRLFSAFLTSRSTFQSTRPVRGETSFIVLSLSFLIFQSTRPVRGETAKVYKLYCYGSYTSDKKEHSILVFLSAAYSFLCSRQVFSVRSRQDISCHFHFAPAQIIRTSSAS